MSCRLTHLKFSSTCSIQIAVLITYQACCHYAKKFFFLIEISDWLLVVGAPRPVIIWRTQRLRRRIHQRCCSESGNRRRRRSLRLCLCLRYVRACDDAAADEGRNEERSSRSESSPCFSLYFSHTSPIRPPRSSKQLEPNWIVDPPFDKNDATATQFSLPSSSRRCSLR